VSGQSGERDLGNAHGDNQRIPVDAFHEGSEFMS
jgi:hypothetical protein